MTNSPLVSIVIVNYSGKNYLEKCLSSLSQTNYENYEIILVDNQSSDDSVSFVKQNYPEIQVIELNKNFGFAVPNNIGSRLAKGKYLVFLNNDTQVTKDWLVELVKPLESDKNIAFGQSLILNSDGSVDSSGDYIDEIGRSYSSHDKPKKIRNILSPKAACMIARRDLFLDLGGFDENFFASFEDVDLGWRSWLWGYKSLVIPTSIIYHLGGQTTKKIPELIAFHGVKNNIILRLTNFDFLDSMKSLTFMISLALLSKLFHIHLLQNQGEKMKIPNLKIMMKAFIWVIKNWNKISKRKNFLKTRKTKTNKELKKLGLITKLKAT